MLSTYKFGIIAELYVYLIYLLRLYNPLHRRYRNYFGEIDLIFTKGRELIFIEVKARRSEEKEVLTCNQIKRIKKAASYFLACNPGFRDYDVRFDLVIIRPWFRANILKNVIT
jgi:putative endonuclease